ncbi:MAG: hypothetical protein APF81_27030 [Desulfosporosinus sp. BRH_c37]|nr:MAG: hypothetical protein APF81_27030 [Desulfosporosinus sp. BRH_c37]
MGRTDLCRYYYQAISLEAGDVLSHAVKKPGINCELKFVAYASPIGTAEGTNKKPSFMVSQFGSKDV